MKKLSPEQLKKLESHQHQSSGTSLLEPFVQLFWNWFSKFLPRWLAPNAILSFGLSVNLTTSVLLIYYCPTATEAAPYWLYATSGAGLVIFQASYVFSHEHACFTGSLSPFNELFNHGCHTVSFVFLILGACVSLKLGNYPWIMTLFCLTANSSFYCWLWCAYVTGVSYILKFHVIEVQFFTVFLYGVNFIFGPTVWFKSISIFCYPLHVIPVSLAILGFVYTIIRYMKIILDGGCGDNGATVADTSIISPIFVIGLIVALAVSVASQSKQSICQSHPVLYLLLLGLTCAKVANSLIISHLTRNELQILDSSMLGLVILFLNQYFSSVFNEYILLWLCMFHTLFDVIYFLSKVYIEVASHLNIRIFSVASPKQHLRTD